MKQEVLQNWDSGNLILTTEETSICTIFIMQLSKDITENPRYS